MNDGQFSGFAASFPLVVILIGYKYKGTKISDFSAPCAICLNNANVI
jgi:hypothetical protein